MKPSALKLWRRYRDSVAVFDSEPAMRVLSQLLQRATPDRNDLEASLELIRTAAFVHGEPSQLRLTRRGRSFLASLDIASVKQSGDLRQMRALEGGQVTETDAPRSEGQGSQMHRSAGGLKIAPKGRTGSVRGASAIPQLRATRAQRTVTNEMIAKRAYEIYASGKGGSQIDNWIRAERELRGER